jgi:hypothetical protein
MPINRNFLVSCVLTLLWITSCNKSTEDPFANCEGTGPDFSISDISGNWTATIGNYLDLISRHSKNIVEEGGYLKLNIESNGRFTMEIKEVDRNLLILTGSFSFCDQKFVARFDDAPKITEEFSPELTESYFRYYGPTDYDYDGDGIEQRVILGFTFVRP